MPALRDPSLRPAFTVHGAFGAGLRPERRRDDTTLGKDGPVVVAFRLKAEATP